MYSGSEVTGGGLALAVKDGFDCGLTERFQNALLLARPRHCFAQTVEFESFRDVLGPTEVGASQSKLILQVHNVLTHRGRRLGRQLSRTFVARDRKHLRRVHVLVEQDTELGPNEK